MRTILPHQLYKSTLQLASFDGFQRQITGSNTDRRWGSAYPPGKPMSMEQHMLDKGAQMLQSLKPIKQISQHLCTLAIHSHDMINQDFLQCAVYDTDDSNGRLIGVEYIVSDKIFESLPPEEQKLWHSHAFEVKSGLLVPALMMSPQGVNMGMVSPALVEKRGAKFNLLTDAIKQLRADYWKQHGKCFAIDIEKTKIKLRTCRVWTVWLCVCRMLI
ncbi:hypothetical protein P3X46_026712 [Hevea brasiliensis]|uniref:Uncharacterized protein n=1 Tax=Hevea brasiliensis TaxID=3981 RepID=A0ABQ9KZS6_HEVBR|nr:hypothetical protein P3X46_026712 [Hevea brasiliensis]